MIGSTQRNLRNIMLTLLFGAMLTFGCYQLTAGLTDDAGFLCVLQFSSIAVMAATSPQCNVILGMRKLWLLE